jgi:hypothetical protein
VASYGHGLAPVSSSRGGRSKISQGRSPASSAMARSARGRSLARCGHERACPGAGVIAVLAAQLGTQEEGMMIIAASFPSV